MNVDAIIPIKEHSTRVPNKNFRILNGKPLYRHIIDTLLKSRYINHIIIDTDVREKIEFLYEEPITIVERPEHLRGDFVSVNKLINHDIKFAKSDNIIQTHTTNPLLTIETIDSALSHYEQFRRPIFCVDKLKQRFWSIEGKPINHDPNELRRTQDLEPIFADNSCFYIFSKQFFERTKKRMDEKSTRFVVDRKESLDIDEEFDWRIAECLVRKQ